MKRNIYTILPAIISVIFIAFTFSGCSETPLFYTIENETAVEDGSLDNRMTFTNMGIFDTNYYVGAGKKLWYRATSGGSWSKLDLPSGYNDSVSGVSSMAIVGTRLYVSVYTAPQSTSAVYYKAANITDSWMLVDESTAVDRDSQTDYVTFHLFATDETNLYINRIEYSIYDAYDHEHIVASRLYYNNFGNAVAVNGLNNLADSSGISGVIVGITSSALIYNVSSGDSLDGIFCKGSGSSFPGATGPNSSQQYYAIGEGGGYRFISVKDDDATNPVYYQLLADTDWSTLGSFPEDDALVSCFYDIDTIETDIVLAGTTDYVTDTLYYADGYYEIDTSTTPTIGDNSFSDSSNYVSTDDDLCYATINKFYIDGTTLFALTQGHGVWKNKLDASTRVWVWE